MAIKSIFFILNSLLPKLRSGSKNKFRQCKNNIISTFVNLAPDARYFNKGIWGEYNNDQAGLAYRVTLLNISNKYITF